jgi:uncharacterized membrane protein YhhN
MAITPKTLFFIIAAVLFAVAALYAPPQPPRVNLIAAGLCFLALAHLFG